jgi:hypothetical protein
MTRRIAAVTGALALQLIALVLAHDLTFLARYGSRYGEELAHAGHGQTWAAAVESPVVLSVVLGVLAIGRLLQLRGRLRGEASRRIAPPGPALRAFLGTWLQVASRISLLGVVLLTIQENIERASIGQAAPGPGILLSPEYPFGLWIAMAVGASVAFVAALFEHRQRVLLARIRAARQVHRRTHRTPELWPRLDVLPAHESVLGRRSGPRAPPLATPA